MLLLILSFLTLTPKEIKYNDNLVIQHFQSIVNQYRKENGLSEIRVDYSLKEFSESHCNYISYNKLTHGTGKLSLEERSKNLLGRYRFVGENLTPYTISKDFFYTDGNWNKIPELYSISIKLSEGIATEYDIAMGCFLRWKYSPSHNSLMLDKDSKWFYLSVNQTNRTELYFQLTCAG